MKEHLEMVECLKLKTWWKDLRVIEVKESLHILIDPEDTEKGWEAVIKGQWQTSPEPKKFIHPQVNKKNSE